MFAGNTHGQMHVTHDGTLTIQVMIFKVPYIYAKKPISNVV